MKTLAETLQATMAMQTNQNPLVSQAGLPPLNSSSPRTKPLDDGRAASDIARFTAALSQVCVAVKQYGKSPSELRELRDMFLTALGDIPAETLTKALFVHINTSDEIPTPRQLRDIVHPPKPVWKPDWSAYNALKRRIHEGYFPLSDERQFLRDCENYAIEKKGKELEAYEDSKRQLKSHIRMLETVDGGIE